MTLQARYFDGRTAQAYDVGLDVHDGLLTVAGSGIDRSEPLDALTVSEPMGRAARLVTFADGAFCEVHDHAGFARLLDKTGFRDSMVVRWQHSWTLILLAVVGLLFLGFAGYRYGIPALAAVVADALPDSVVQRIGAETWERIDGQVFKPSTLDAARRKALIDRIDTMPEARAVPHTIVFRDGGPIGANAFALPPGTIVVTDALVNAAAGDDQVIGVIAHEIGHVAGRHSLRLVLESTIVGLVLSATVGDISTLVATAPAVMLRAGYSRDLESEADDFAARMLKSNGISPAVLADMLDTLQKLHDGKSADGRGASSTLSGFLASHPPTEERKRRLRQDAGR